ncbi:MAG: hypothetical protein IK095_04810 [Oscillospiraceae bacterium]|nr:hypothetical protein [Oscillospiraceae bacterium]
MSSGVESGGAIAGVVLLPVGLALGAGWLAWQAGALLVRADQAANAQIQAVRERQAAEAQQRHMAALAGRKELLALCERVRAELSAHGDLGQIADVEQMRFELDRICAEELPEDSAKLEAMNVVALMKVQEIVSRQRRLGQLRVKTDAVYDGIAVADLMDDLRTAFASMQIRRTQGGNVAAADPLALERAALDKRLDEVAARVIAAADFAVVLGRDYGIAERHRVWLESVLNGLDERIGALYAPSMPNDRLKKGIRSLEELMQEFDMIRPGLEKERRELDLLYPIYAKAAVGFGEKARELRSFKSAKELRAEMERLKGRQARAEECAAIYRELGRAAYVCLAWDQELAAMGYRVKPRSQTRDLTAHKPKRATVGEQKLPFYDWDGKEMTQFYSISDTCHLQLIVHPDGSTTMQTIVTGDDTEKDRQTQKQHCASLARLHERLAQNWFLSYGYDEILPPEELFTAADWRVENRDIWPEEVEERREERQEEQQEERREERRADRREEEKKRFMTKP